MSDYSGLPPESARRRPGWPVVLGLLLMLGILLVVLVVWLFFATFSLGPMTF